MGIIDKVKMELQNADSRLEQEFNSAKFDDKIKEQKSERSRILLEAGEKMLASYKSSKHKLFGTKLTDEVKALLEKADSCEMEIAKLEKEKTDMISDSKAKRQANRDAVEKS